MQSLVLNLLAINKLIFLGNETSATLLSGILQPQTCNSVNDHIIARIILPWHPCGSYGKCLHAQWHLRISVMAKLFPTTGWIAKFSHASLTYMQNYLETLYLNARYRVRSSTTFCVCIIITATKPINNKVLTLMKPGQIRYWIPNYPSFWSCTCAYTLMFTMPSLG